MTPIKNIIDTFSVVGTVSGGLVVLDHFVHCFYLLKNVNSFHIV